MVDWWKHYIDLKRNVFEFIGLTLRIAVLFVIVVSIAIAGALMFSSPGDDPTAANFDEEAVEWQIHQQMNEERAERDLRKLDYDSRLASIAENHSRDMAARNYYSHNSPEGDNFEDRYRRAGYECNVRINGSYTTDGAENIDKTYVNRWVDTNRGERYYKNESELATGFTNELINSTEHRDIILKPHWREEGVGVVVTDNGTVYATQNFC